MEYNHNRPHHGKRNIFEALFENLETSLATGAILRGDSADLQILLDQGIDLGTLIYRLNIYPMHIVAHNATTHHRRLCRPRRHSNVHSLMVMAADIALENSRNWIRSRIYPDPTA